MSDQTKLQPLPPEPTVEVLEQLSPGDLNDLCDATDAAIEGGGGFGWVDFLGVGSERAVGSKMRKLEQKLLRPSSVEEALGGRGRMIIVGELNLDQPRTLQALKKLLGLYAAEPEEDTPMTFVLMGNFVQHAVMARGGSGGSIKSSVNEPKSPLRLLLRRFSSGIAGDGSSSGSGAGTGNGPG